MQFFWKIRSHIHYTFRIQNWSFENIMDNKLSPGSESVRKRDKIAVFNHLCISESPLSIFYYVMFKWKFSNRFCPFSLAYFRDVKVVNVSQKHPVSFVMKPISHLVDQYRQPNFKGYFYSYFMLFLFSSFGFETF